MTSTDEARRVAERYASVWLADDLAGILDCYSDEFTLHYFGNNPFSGTHAGKDASLQVLLDVGALAPRKLLAVDEILAGPGSAVMVVREDLTAGGKTTEIRRVLRFRIEGEQFTDCWLYEEDQALIDAAWSAGGGASA